MELGTMRQAIRIGILLGLGMGAVLFCKWAFGMYFRHFDEAMPIIISAALVPVVYFVPIYIAVNRNHPQKVPIAIVNVFLGWTLIGWVVSLAMACANLNRNR